MSELMEMLRRGIDEGQTNHNISMAGVLEQVCNNNDVDDNNEKKRIARLGTVPLRQLS